MSKKVNIYSMSQCPFCEAAKALLKQRNIPFQEVRLSQDDDAQWDALYKRSGMKTVPQIFLGDSLIGGFQELARLDKKDGLASLKA